MYPCPRLFPEAASAGGSSEMFRSQRRTLVGHNASWNGCYWFTYRAGVEFPTRTWAMGCRSLSPQNVSLEKVLPLDYSTILLPPVVGVCSTPVCRNEQVAILQLQSPTLSALRELERTGTTMESNVQLRLVVHMWWLPYEYHGVRGACKRWCTGSVTSGDPQIIVQFDGSAHQTSQVGGAGAALLQFDGNGLALLDWDACDIVAEANGADLAEPPHCWWAAF